jgi:hypothetical protein
MFSGNPHFPLDKQMFSDSSSYSFFLVGGWAYPSEKYEFVSWDDEIPNIWKMIKTNQLF